MDIKLTKDEKHMLYVLYQEYKCRIKNGSSKQRAREFLSLEKLAL